MTTIITPFVSDPVIIYSFTELAEEIVDCVSKHAKEFTIENIESPLDCLESLGFSVDYQEKEDTLLVLSFFGHWSNTMQYIFDILARNASCNIDSDMPGLAFVTDTNKLISWVPLDGNSFYLSGMVIWNYEPLMTYLTKRKESLV